MQENDGVFMQAQTAAVPMEEILARRAIREAEDARHRAEARLSLTVQVVLVHGNTEDVDAATKALARVASKAMRRR